MWLSAYLLVTAAIPYLFFQLIFNTDEPFIAPPVAQGPFDLP